MTVYQRLASDHRTILQLFEEIDRTPPAAIPLKSALFATLSEALLLHAEAEQEVFYVAMLDASADPAPIVRSLEVHSAIRKALESVDEEFVGGTTWTMKLGALKRLVLAHVLVEEDELFSLARERLSESEAVELAERIHRIGTLADEEEPESIGVTARDDEAEVTWDLEWDDDDAIELDDADEESLVLPDEEKAFVLHRRWLH